MAAFFQKLVFCIVICAAGEFQKSWKIGVITTVKMARPSAAQRACQPTSSSRPRPSSATIAMAAATSGSGTPLELM